MSYEIDAEAEFDDSDENENCRWCGDSFVGGGHYCGEACREADHAPGPEDNRQSPSSITGVEVELTGQDGNALAILGRCRAAMRRARVDSKVIEEFTAEAMSGNYDRLLQTCMNYCEVS